MEVVEEGSILSEVLSLLRGGLAPLKGCITPVIILHFSRSGSAVRTGRRQECHVGLGLIDLFAGRR